MKTKNEQSFDCVDFKHRAQERIYEQTKGLSARQRAQYFEKQAEGGPLGAWWRQLKAAQVQKISASRQRGRRSA
jgi:hypothetical protein